MNLPSFCINYLTMLFIPFFRRAGKLRMVFSGGHKTFFYMTCRFDKYMLLVFNRFRYN
jgi:hypothetical protein